MTAPVTRLLVPTPSAVRTEDKTQTAIQRVASIAERAGREAELDRVDRLNEGKFTSISFFPAAAGLSRCMRASVTWGRNGLASFWPKAPDGTGRLAVAGGRA